MAGFIAACCIGRSVAAGSGDTPEFLSARVAQALTHDDLATAARLLDQGLGASPNHPALLAQRAELSARQGRGTVVARELMTFGESAPPMRTPAASAGLGLREGQSLIGQGRLASAANHYRELLRSAPDDLEARTALGNTHFWRGDWRGAQNEFNSVLNADPRNVPARLGYIKSLHAAGRATAAYQQAVELNRVAPNDPEVGLALANIVAGVDADEQVSGYLSRPTNDPDVQRRQNAFRAQRAIARGRRDEGLALSSLWLGAHPRDYDALTDMAEAHINAGQVAKARAFYEQAGAINPQRTEAALGLARTAFLSGRHKDALQLYQHAAAANPESLDAALGVARLAHITGDKQRAWQAINTAAQLAPGSANVHEAATQLAYQLGDRASFQSAVNAWAGDQPADTRPDLWAQKWNVAHGLKPDLRVLNALLDPLAPETSSEALKILRQHGNEPRGNLTSRLPAAPTPELALAAQAKLSNQVKLLQPALVGFATGYELGSLHDTTGAGAHLPSWHEAYVAGFWGQPLGHTLSLDVRRYERFGLTAWQVLPGWGYELNKDWSVHLGAGGAVSGTFIPKWRVGAGVTRNFTPTLSATLDFNYLSYVDADTLQLVPGVSW